MRFRIVETERARRLVESLSFTELLNQVCCPAYGRFDDEHLAAFGATFFPPTERSELTRHIEKCREACGEIPPFIVSDLESGPGNMILGATRFPSMMAISQADSPELAYEVGKLTAAEAREIGFNWTFSPVADLAADSDSPVVTMRSAGKFPDQVVRIAGAYMVGLQAEGMMATVKHFPGDGFSSWDQHLTTPVLSLDAEAWSDGPGRVFQALIDQGAMAVMPGHIACPAFDEADEHGLYPPATVSKRLLVDLLRDKLGFEGLIVSDAIEMGGVVGYMNYYDACAAALMNGCDVLLFPRIDDRFYAEMERRCENGQLTIETLRARAVRIVSLKEQLGLFDEAPSLGSRRADDAANDARALALAEQVVARSITAVRDRKGLLPYPIGPETQVLHAVILNGYERYEDMLARMKTEIGKYAGAVDQWIDPGPDALFAAARDQAYDLIVCSIGSRHSYGLNVIRLHGEMARNMMGGWTKLGTPVIFVAHFHPFVHQEYEASIDTIVNTYGDIECSAEHLIRAITGRQPLNRQLFAHD